MEFPGVLALGLNISEGCTGVTQFCGVSRGEALFFSGIFRESEKPKNPQGFSKRHVFFLEQSIVCLEVAKS